MILHAVATKAKAVCLGKALKPEFRLYATQVLANAWALAKTLFENRICVITGGTDNPLILVDLWNLQLTGQHALDALEASGLICNKNSVP